jgi:hypothetical protein
MGEFLLGVISSVVAAILIAVCLRIFTSVLPSWQWRWNLFRSLGRLRRSGVRHLITSRAEYRYLRGGETIPQYLSSVTRSLVYVGFWHAKGIEMDNLEATFTTLVNRGCHVEIVLLDPAIDEVRAEVIAAYLGITLTSFRARLMEAWDQMRRYRLAIPAERREQFILRAHREAVYSSCFIIDHGAPNARILVDIKLYGIGRENSFAIELADPKLTNSLYDRFAISFQRIRDKSVVQAP